MNEIFSPEFIKGLAGQLSAPVFHHELGVKQPIHTIYGGAHLFSEKTFDKISEVAIRIFNTYAVNTETIAQVFPQTGVLGFPTAELHESVLQQLQTHAVEDYRIDFEDGYGYRSDAEEDTHAKTAAIAAASILLQEAYTGHLGMRVKPLSKTTVQRSLRTLEIFFTQLAETLDGAQPEGFLITLPKVETVNQVEIFVAAVDTLSSALGWNESALKIELMIETPSAIIGPTGVCNIPLLIEAAGNRLFSIHAGLYDFTGALDITANDQMYKHPYCDYLRFFLVAAGKSAGINISDGATSFLPVEKYKNPANANEFNENKRIIWKAWRLHFENVLHSLSLGIVQGWDLHPAQIPVRFAANFYYYRRDKEKLLARLKHFLAAAAQATSQNGTFDDAASAQGLLNFVLKGYECGALTEADFAELGIARELLLTRNFETITNANK